MLSSYPACFIKEENAYSVIFPDLNYLATCGDTLDEAIAMAIDCLAGYLYWLKEDGEPAPEPSPIDKINLTDCMKKLEVSDYSLNESFINYVTVDVLEYAKKHFEKSVRKTLTIPKWLNDKAIGMGINFSKTLQEALLQKVNA